MGREYAMNHLTVFVSLVSTMLDWDHHITKDSNTMIFSPTVIPEDGVIVTLRPRVAVASK